MLLLAIDSSHRRGTLSIARGEDAACQVIATNTIEDGNFSAHFIPQLSRMMRDSNILKEQIDCFACASGPGSFTGLRVGLAAIKALAEVLDKPIVPVSALECIASAAGEEHGFVIAALDAGRGESYVGEYHRQEKLWRMKREFLATSEELSALLRGFDVPPLLLTPEESIAAAARLAGALETRIVSNSSSETVARLAMLKFAAGETVTVDKLEANYVRRDQSLYR